MGVLESVLAGAVGAEMATVVNGVIEKHGGLAGLANQLQQKGLGDAVKSWIGTGPNLPVSADQIHNAIGADTIRDLAAKFGVSTQDIAGKLANALPKAIDHLTPGGVLPKS
jgi:uncharacterized protein YidB (DUF937 family)